MLLGSGDNSSDAFARWRTAGPTHSRPCVAMSRRGASRCSVRTASRALRVVGKRRDRSWSRRSRGYPFTHAMYMATARLSNELRPAPEMRGTGLSRLASPTIAPRLHRPLQKLSPIEVEVPGQAHSHSRPHCPRDGTGATFPTPTNNPTPLVAHVVDAPTTGSGSGVVPKLDTALAVDGEAFG